MEAEAPKCTLNVISSVVERSLRHTPIQLVAPNAVSTAVIIDAKICSVHFNVSFFPMLIKLKIKN